MSDSATQTDVRNISPVTRQKLNAYFRSLSPAKGNDASRWRRYEECKGQISAICGWDAPRGEQDMQLYHTALAVLVRRLRI